MRRLLVTFLLLTLPVFAQEPDKVTITLDRETVEAIRKALPSPTPTPEALPGHHVSPLGTDRASGKPSEPFSLQYALDGAGGKVKPGDTVWIRAGVYTKDYGGAANFNKSRFIASAAVSGTAERPIIYRAYTGERVVLDGLGLDGWKYILDVQGQYKWFWGIEITDSVASRLTAIAGADGAKALKLASGVGLRGANNKLINCIIHDVANGVFQEDGSSPSEIYGCLLFNNGWDGGRLLADLSKINLQGDTHGHGHGLYLQNTNERAWNLISDVISYNNQYTGMKAFAVNTNSHNFAFENVIAFNNGASFYEFRGQKIREHNIQVSGSNNPIKDARIVNNSLYLPPGHVGVSLNLGWVARDNETATITNNRIMGGSQAFSWKFWKGGVFTGNKLYVNQVDPSVRGSNMFLVNLVHLGDAFTWDRNEYFDTTGRQNNYSRVFQFNYKKSEVGGGQLAFAGSGKNSWLAHTGFDKQSTYRTEAPKGIEVVIYPNKYEAGRAHVAVYNWEKSEVVKLDLSQILRTGDEFEIRSIEDLFGAPLLAGKFKGEVVIRLTDKVTGPRGLMAPRSVAPEFAALVVLLK